MSCRRGEASSHVTSGRCTISCPVPVTKSFRPFSKHSPPVASRTASGAATRPHEADSEGPCFQNNGFCNKRRAAEGRNQFRMKSFYLLVKRARAPVASSPSGNASLVGRILEVLDDQSVRWHHGSIAPCSSSTSSCLSDQSTGMDGAPTTIIVHCAP